MSYECLVYPHLQMWKDIHFILLQKHKPTLHESKTIAS